MFIRLSNRTVIIILSILIPVTCAACFLRIYARSAVNTENNTQCEQQFIKWVDFNVSYEALCDAMEADISSYGTDNHYLWTDMLAYLAAENGNDFSGYNKKKLTALVERLDGGESMAEITNNMKYFPYYQETLTAVLGEFIGEYCIQVPDDDPDTPVWERRYGLKAFCPIAKNYSFEHYSDFGNARTYGYARRHTGHDLFGSIGTPVIAVESGIVECVGWNQYGGWRIGIRSFDKKRYYYYAHLRKDFPYSSAVKEGAVIKAGDVIGYLGMTGYSTTENVNNINVPHLHIGLQLIFDESQKDGPTEIWVDTYNLVKLLQKNYSEVYKDEKTNEYVRRYDFYEASLGGN
ncbi:MAG: M23 family metallopeptidase [Clostridiales bacterium]|nr:M23 family metallopeptidase [Clostridiales bacterium]